MSRFAKSIIAALAAGLGALQIALGDDVVTQTEWVKIGSATLAALGFVWGVPNKTVPAVVSGDGKAGGGSDK